MDDLDVFHSHGAAFAVGTADADLFPAARGGNDRGFPFVKNQSPDIHTALLRRQISISREKGVIFAAFPVTWS